MNIQINVQSECRLSVSEKPAFWRPEREMSKSLFIQFLHHPDYRIQCHRHDTQQHDRHEQPVHFEEVKGQKDKMTIVFFMVDSANKFNFRDSEIALRKIWRL